MFDFRNVIAAPITAGGRRPGQRRAARHADGSTRAVGGAAALLIGVAVSGCAHRDLADWRVRQRTDGMGDTVAVWAQAERPRPARLSRAGEYLARNTALHAERFERDLEYTGRWYERDVQRFRERQPDYGYKLDQILRGRLERIEPHAIILFY